MWDANNETVSPELVKIIDAVRSLDLSDRAWDNSWSPPAGPNDPVEVHPYLLNPHLISGSSTISAGLPSCLALQGNRLQVTAILSTNTAGCGFILMVLLSTSHKRSTTTRSPAAQPKRMEFRWYLTGGPDGNVASPACATAVLYYEYLGSYLPRKSPGPYDFGPFSDLSRPAIAARFEDYMTEAFKPLGVYMDFWGDGKPGGFRPSTVVSIPAARNTSSRS